jgi:uncharacterized protein YeaO (DUF488 family)
VSLGKIKTKSIYDSKETSDGIRILVTRYWPRGKKKSEFDLWLKSLSPPRNTIALYKKGEFDISKMAADYNQHINSHITKDMLNDIQSILDMLKSGTTVTLLCYEREGEFCHRHLLKSHLESKLLDQ